MQVYFYPVLLLHDIPIFLENFYPLRNSSTAISAIQTYCFSFVILPQHFYRCISNQCPFFSEHEEKTCWNVCYPTPALLKSGNVWMCGIWFEGESCYKTLCNRKVGMNSLKGYLERDNFHEPKCTSIHISMKGYLVIRHICNRNVEMNSLKGYFWKTNVDNSIKI